MLQKLQYCLGEAESNSRFNTIEAMKADVRTLATMALNEFARGGCTELQPLTREACIKALGHKRYIKHCLQNNIKLTQEDKDALIEFL